MAKDDAGGRYPDLSGVFQIDDNEIPTNIILQKQPETPESAAARAAEPILLRKPGEARRQTENSRRKPAPRPEASYARSREPVLLRQPDDAQARRDQKLALEERQRMREERRRKQRRNALIRRVAVFGGAAVILIVLLTVAFHKPVPQILTENVREAAVEASFTVQAALIQDPLGTGEEYLYAVAALTPEEAASVQENSKVKLVYDDAKTVTGVVSAIRTEPADSSLLETLGTLLPAFTVQEDGVTLAVMLPDDPAAVLGGDVVSAQVVTAESRQTLTVPRRALRTDGTDVYVWVYGAKGAGKKLTRRTVTVGLLSDDAAEITNGLEKGETVVIGCTLPPTDVKDGMKVKIVKTE